ncbi:hypothetical protein [Litchfieldia salsa]|uniref:Uncharacterized protein n=1 Tax=Litchfieldia salsa TaxID=930152 RepID=A0A1H0VPH4_9BACI|nr:hypothetical protein [Litchfieldia salsa]SDP80075.1 hypothetical protein SAMN05216565_107106 [Litchfieldia salsa]
MNSEITSAILEITFSRLLVFIVPFLFLLMITLFSEEMIDLIYKSVKRR